jgi:4-amino-4-deoxy-L-arabinose transferase-like glycosyltransferase
VTPGTSSATKKLNIGWVLLLILSFLLVFALLFSRAMTTTLNHDEYQFVAGGELLAERGLLPYRDYPFLHMPYMLLANALLFRLTEYDFLAARLLTAACGLASVVLLFHFIFRLFEGKGKFVQSTLACVSVILFVLNNAYIDANGRALNHALPNLLALLALEAFYLGLKKERAGPFFLFCGFFVGLAAGTRLTYALLAPAFACAVFITPFFQSGDVKSNPWRVGLRSTLFFFSGVFVALLPVIILALSAPSQFLFGNFVYIRLNTGYRKVLDYGEAMTLGSKLAYFLGNVLSEPASLLIYTLALAFGIGASFKLAKTKDPRWILGVLVTLLSLGMFVSAFGPTPTWPQYFFAPLPFLIIGALGVVALAFQRSPRLGWSLAGLVLLLALVNNSAGQVFSDLKQLSVPQSWVPLQIHAFDRAIRHDLPEGKVLTLAPVFPLEAGLDTYEMFTVGPLVWRSAHILSAEKRRQYQIIAYSDLDTFLADQPPAAILLGVEDRYDGFWIYNAGALEGPLLEYAESHGYHPQELSPGFGEGVETLWIK